MVWSRWLPVQAVRPRIDADPGEQITVIGERLSTEVHMQNNGGCQLRRVDLRDQLFRGSILGRIIRLIGEQVGLLRLQQ
jgi:hypothetical protein